MPEPRVAHGFFCDEFRPEPGGKLSFKGVFTGDLAFGVERRGTQINFAAVAWLICDPDDVPPLVSIRVYGPPGRRLLHSGEIRPGNPPRRADSTKAFIQLALERIGLSLSQEGDLECVIETERGILRAARTRVRFVTDQALKAVSS